MAMNDKLTDEKIAGSIESAKKKYLVNYDFTKDYSFALQYPEGPKPYFIKKRFELANQIEHESMFGHAWARFLCNSDILNTDWIYKCTKNCLDSMDEKTVWNQLELFLNQFVLWLRYTDFIENSKQEPDNIEPIIERERLALIFRKYKDCFNEPEDTWIKRFVYPNEAPVNPLKLDPKAIEGSNKLVLLAILASIQDNRKDSFDYTDFVFDRFGINNFYKARHDHKEKKSFEETFAECNDILIE